MSAAPGPSNAGQQGPPPPTIPVQDVDGDEAMSSEDEEEDDPAPPPYEIPEGITVEQLGQRFLQLNQYINSQQQERRQQNRDLIAENQRLRGTLGEVQGRLNGIHAPRARDIGEILKTSLPKPFGGKASELNPFLTQMDNPFI